MYPSNDPTQGAIYRHNDNRKAWLAVAGGVVAVLVVAFLVVAACSGRDSQTGTPLGAAGSPPASGVGASGSAGGTGDEQPGDGDAEQTGGGDQGDGDPGQPDGDDPGDGDHDDPQDDGGDPEPEPLGLEAVVFDPPPTIGCRARGQITVTGGEHPMELSYLWYRMQQPAPNLPAVPIPFGAVQTLDIEGPGEYTVNSPDFPENQPQNVVMLVATTEPKASSGFVAYPKCTKLVLRAP